VEQCFDIKEERGEEATKGLWKVSKGDISKPPASKGNVENHEGVKSSREEEKSQTFSKNYKGS